MRLCTNSALSVVLLVAATTAGVSAFGVIAPTKIRTVFPGNPQRQKFPLPVEDAAIITTKTATITSRSAFKRPSRRFLAKRTVLAVAATEAAETSSATFSAETEIIPNRSSADKIIADATASAVVAAVLGGEPLALPPRDAETGVWQLATPADHAALLSATTPHEIVVLKVFAPWCRACKGLDPKFVQLSRDPAYGGILSSTTTDVASDASSNSDDSSSNKPLPIQWASLNIQHNKAFVQSLGVLALPTIQFYVAGQLVDTFPCGPSKVPMLKRKLAALLSDYVDLEHRVLKPMPVGREAAEEAAAKAKAARSKNNDTNSVNGDGSSRDSEAVPPSVAMTSAERSMFRSIPYFSSMSLADMDQVLDQAVELTFPPGSLLVREGQPGRTFYVIKSGEVEICQQTANYASAATAAAAQQYLADPMVQPPSNNANTAAATTNAVSDAYLGSVVNRLDAGDHFGERSLITGEPRAASLRVAEDEPVTLWAIDQDAFPFSCVLSGKSKNTAQTTLRLLEQVNDKYGVENGKTSSVEEMDELDAYRQQVLSKQVKESATASQVRGSVYTTAPLSVDDSIVDSGVGTREERVDLEEYADADFVSSPSATSIPAGLVVPNDDAIFSLLTRFQMIRHVSTCFRYIQKTRAVWGDPGSRTRRNILVARLSNAQRMEFSEIFTLMDVNQDGCLEVNELQRLLATSGEEISNDELNSVMRVTEDDIKNNKIASDCPKSLPGTSISPLGTVAATLTNTDLDNCVGPGVMTYEDYMGIMAEAEFYYLFNDIFSSLDEKGSGYVKASDLDRVLCGVRDLISDDRKSVIDVDDKDMLIDYEQFSRMLLGTTLI